MRHLFSSILLLVALATGCGGNELDELEAGPELGALEVATSAQALTMSNCTALAVTAVSANGNDGNVPANVLDDNLSTRWSQLGKGAWLQLDLGSAKGVGGVAVAWHAGNQRKNTFVLTTSTDGVTYTQVSSGVSTGTTTAAETYRFTGVSARYVRVVVNGNTLNDWASIAEARVCTGTATAPAPAPAPTPGGVVWRGDLETGDISQWSSSQKVSADRLQVVADPVRQGRYALKTTVYQYDDPINSSGNRNELVRMTREPVGSEYFYRFGVLFATSYPLANTWQLFAQWHHEGSGGSPPLEFTVYGDYIELVTQSAPPNQVKTVHWRGPLARGTWHDFVLHVKWSPDKTVGFIELYHNDLSTPALPKRAVATQFPNQLNYLKAGLYRNESIAPVGVVYHDGWVMGRTLADVLQ